MSISSPNILSGVRKTASGFNYHILMFNSSLEGYFVNEEELVLVHIMD